MNLISRRSRTRKATLRRVKRYSGGSFEVRATNSDPARPHSGPEVFAWTLRALSGVLKASFGAAGPSGWSGSSSLSRYPQRCGRDCGQPRNPNAWWSWTRGSGQRCHAAQWHPQPVHKLLWYALIPIATLVNPSRLLECFGAFTSQSVSSRFPLLVRPRLRSFVRSFRILEETSSPFLSPLRRRTPH